MRKVWLDIRDGNGYVDITDYIKDESLKIKMCAGNAEFRSQQNTCTFTIIPASYMLGHWTEPAVAGVAISGASTSGDAVGGYTIKAIDGDILIEVYDDTTLLFRGHAPYLRSRSYDGEDYSSIITVEATDSLDLLDVAVGDIDDPADDVVYFNNKIYDPLDTDNSIIHKLGFLKGWTASDFSTAITISTTVEVFAPVNDSDSILTIMDTLLYEYGYILTMNAADQILPVQWIQDLTTPVAFEFNDLNILNGSDGIKITENVVTEEGYKLTYYEVGLGATTEGSNNMLVYQDSELPYSDTGTFAGYALYPRSTYPVETNVIDDSTHDYQLVYQDYSDVGINYFTNKAIVNRLDFNYKAFDSDFSDIIATTNHVLDWGAQSGITVEVANFYNKKCRILFRNTDYTNSKSLYYCNVYAKIYYKTAERTIQIDNITDTTKIKEYVSTFIFDSVNAQQLAQYEAAKLKLKAAIYTFSSTEYVAPGTIVCVNLDDGTLQRCIVTSEAYDDYSDSYTYELTAISPLLGAVTKRTVTKSPVSTTALSAVASLTNEAVVVPSNADGSGPILTEATTTMQITIGRADVSDYYTYTVVETGITGTLVDGVYTVTSFDSDATYTGNAVITASRTGYLSLSKIFTVTKGRAGLTGSTGTSARSVNLTSTYTGFSYDTNGANPSPATATITATPHNSSGTVYYEFKIDGVSVQNTTSPTYTYTAQTAYTSMPDVITVNLREGAVDSTILATDQLTLVGVRAGANGITVTLSNEAHSLPQTSVSGIDYTGSGTTIRVLDGTTQLNEDSTSPYANSTFRVTAVGTNITPGAMSGAGTSTITFADHSLMLANNAAVVYTVIVKNAAGVESTFVKNQSLSLSLQGTAGDPGRWPADTAISNYYNCNETTGTTLADSSGNSRDGTLVGDATWGAGVASGGLYFPGVDDSVTFSYANSTEYSVALWAKRIGTGLTQNVIYLARSTTALRISIRFSTTDYAQALFVDTDATTRTINALAVSDTNWHFYEFTHDGTTGRFYVDAVLQGSATYAMNATAYTSARIGANILGTYGFNGYVDEVRIYGRAHAQDEINGLYRFLVAGSEGPAGTDATTYYITPSAGNLVRSSAGAYSPSTTTAYGYSKTGTGTPAAYLGYWKIYETYNNVAWTLTYTSTANEASKVYTPSDSMCLGIKVELYASGGTATLLSTTYVTVTYVGKYLGRFTTTPAAPYALGDWGQWYATSVVGSWQYGHLYRFDGGTSWTFANSTDVTSDVNYSKPALDDLMGISSGSDTVLLGVKSAYIDSVFANTIKVQNAVYGGDRYNADGTDNVPSAAGFWQGANGVTKINQAIVSGQINADSGLFSGNIDITDSGVLTFYTGNRAIPTVGDYKVMYFGRRIVIYVYDGVNWNYGNFVIFSDTEMAVDSTLSVQGNVRVANDLVVFDNAIIAGYAQITGYVEATGNITSLAGKGRFAQGIEASGSITYTSIAESTIFNTLNTILPTVGETRLIHGGYGVLVSVCLIQRTSSTMFTLWGMTGLGASSSATVTAGSGTLRQVSLAW